MASVLACGAGIRGPGGRGDCAAIRVRHNGRRHDDLDEAPSMAMLCLEHPHGRFISFAGRGAITMGDAGFILIDEADRKGVQRGHSYAGDSLARRCAGTPRPSSRSRAASHMTALANEQPIAEGQPMTYALVVSPYPPLGPASKPRHRGGAVSSARAIESPWQK